MQFSIQGLQQAQAANLRAMAAVSPNGGLGRAVQYALVSAQRYETSIVHVDTGALRASQRIEYSGTRGTIYTDPSAINPRSRRRVIDYAAVEHNRGYPHNYAQRTVDERGDQIAQSAAQGILDEIH